MWQFKVNEDTALIFSEDVCLITLDNVVFLWCILKLKSHPLLRSLDGMEWRGVGIHLRDDVCYNLLSCIDMSKFGCRSLRGGMSDC